MSLSRAQVRLVVETGLFDEAIRKALALAGDMAPFIRRLSLARQRDRSRVVTRRRQRSKW